VRPTASHANFSTRAVTILLSLHIFLYITVQHTYAIYLWNVNHAMRARTLSYLAVGETAWQPLRVQTLYGCSVLAIAISHSTSQYQISARDSYDFSSCGNVAFLLVEATACCRFYYWSEVAVKIVVQSTYTSIKVEWVW